MIGKNSNIPMKVKSSFICSYVIFFYLFFKVPSTIAEEKKYNPFMRVTESSVMQFAKSNDAIETMKVIRLQKDNFKA